MSSQPNETPPAPVAGSSCICTQWCQVANHRVAMLTGHHPDCQQAKPALDAAFDLIEEMRLGIEDWAAEEDGVHPKIWPAYRRACAIRGIFHPENPH